MAILNGTLPTLADNDKINITFRLFNISDSDFCKCGVLHNNSHVTATATSPLEIRACAKHSKHLFTIVKYAVVSYGEKLVACHFTNRYYGNDDNGCLAMKRKSFLFTEDIVTLLAEKCPRLRALRVTGADLTALPCALVRRLKTQMTSLVEFSVIDCFKVSAFNERSLHSILYTGRAVRSIIVGESREVDDSTVRRFAGSLKRMTTLTVRNCPNVTCRSLIYVADALDGIGWECEVRITNDVRPFDEGTILKMLSAEPDLEWSALGANDFRPRMLSIRKKSCPYRVAKFIQGQFYVDRIRF